MRSSALFIELLFRDTAHSTAASEDGTDEEYTQIEVKVASHTDMTIAEADEHISPDEILQGVRASTFKMKMLTNKSENSEYIVECVVRQSKWLKTTLCIIAKLHMTI